MSRYIKNRRGNKQRIPGDLIYNGQKKVALPFVNLIQFNEETFNEQRVEDMHAMESLVDKECVNWFDVNGVHDGDLLRSIGTQFNLHTLTLEDIINTGGRAKVATFDDYTSVLLKMMRIEESDNRVHSEQLTCIISDHIIITFQERKGDVFENVRERLRKQRGRIRRSDSSYLAYALFDAIFNNYLNLIEALGSQIEDNEDLVIENPNESLLARINDSRSELNFLQSHIRPSRDAIRDLLREEGEHLKESTTFYLRDLVESGTQAVDVLENYREMLKDQRDSLSASSANKLNEVMRFLTVFSVIFIPLSFLVGLYGTNFSYIPELAYHYGYFIFLGVLVIVALFMILVFKRKKWL
jgi:magnesium transporter